MKSAVSSFASRVIAIGLVLVPVALGTPATTRAQVAPERTLVVTPGKGPAGTDVTLSGTGWGENVDTASVAVVSPERPGVTHADVANGRLTGSVTIPSDIADGTLVAVEACQVSAGDDAVVDCAAAHFLVARPTLVLSQTSGAAGTVVALSGSGWGTPDRTPTVTPSGTASVVDGELTGTVTIPTDVAGGKLVPVQVCAPYAGRRTPLCLTSDFSVDPVLTATPTTALPGATIDLGGSWCCFSQRDVTWGSADTVIGTARTNADGVISGSARIPLDAAEGDGVLAICDGDVDAETCGTATVAVEAPTLRTDRSDYRIGDEVQLSGEGWCCPDAAVVVTDAADGIRWGDGTVDADGRLRAGATVPDGTEAGDLVLSVCAGARCRTVSVRVVTSPASTDQPTTVPPATSAPSVTTAPASPPVTSAPPPPPDQNGQTWWPVVVVAAVVGGALALLRRGRSHRRGRTTPIVRPGPAVHQLVPRRPVAVVVSVDVPRTTTRPTRSTS